MILKKGQAGGAAGVVFILTLLLILYILFIPGDAREELIDGYRSGDGGSYGSNNSNEITLFRESPGLIDYRAGDDKKVLLNSFNIKALSGAAVLLEQNGAEVMSSVFEERDHQIDFEVSPSLTEDLILSFAVEQGLGSLEINFNDKTIFRGPTLQGDMPPLNIPNRLIERNNEISFSVDSPGIAFWRVHRYVLNNLRVIGDVTDIDENSATQSFNIRSSDFDVLETAQFRFLPVCSSQSRDLQVYLNGASIFRGSPDCDIFNRLSIDSSFFEPGINRVTFELGRGELLVDELELSLSFTDLELPVYYFDLDADEFLDNGSLKEGSVDLGLRFASREDVSMRVYVNGRVFGLTSDGTEYTRDISDFVLPGVNSVEIVPQSRVRISEVRAVRKR